MKKRTLFMTRAALIAALYVVLTFLSHAAGLASGLVQVRISEALAVFCVFTSAGICGVTVGCLLSNIITGCMLPDVICGTLATLIGAVGTRMVGRKAPRLAPLPTVLANTLTIPFLLYYAYGFRPLWLGFLTVFAGEAISCYALGLPLYFLIKRYKHSLGLDD